MRPPKLVRPLAVLLPLVVGAACATATDDADRDDTRSSALVGTPTPPVLGGGVTQGPRPPTTDVYLMPMSTNMLVQWGFLPASVQTVVVHRRDVGGSWAEVHREANTTAGTHSWLDPHPIHASCYSIESIDPSGQTASSRQACTVMPDGTFPHGSSVPSDAVQWSGLSDVDDQVQELGCAEGDLVYRHRDWGVSLGLDDPSNDTDKVYAQRYGSDASWPLMSGEPLALHVAGVNAGWLVHAHQTWGVDLGFSATPSYEWYVTGGASSPGGDILGTYALWNASAQDFLVPGDETFGVHLNWYRKTLPTDPGTSPVTGVSVIYDFNCTTERIPLHIWIADLTAGTTWVDHGELAEQWDADGSCPSVGSPFSFAPTSGHAYELQAVDVTSECTGEPDTGSCVRQQWSFTGNAGAGAASSEVL